MIKKILFIFFVILSFSGVYASNTCFFNTVDSSSCIILSNSFNNFNLNFNNLSLLDHFDAKIYKKENQINRIKLKIDSINNIVTNINPFIEPGVYILEVNSFNLAGIKKTSKYEFIYTNGQPMPPFIPLNLESNQIFGKTQFSNTSIYAYNLNNIKFVNTPIVSNGVNNTFNINLQGLTSGINYVKFKTKNSNGVFSESLERIIYLNKPISNKNLVITSISLDDLNLINDRTINQNTTKRNFYVQGSITAPNPIGAIVYVNGIKTIVDSNSKFGQFILLNEGLNKIIVQNFNNSVNISTNVNYINPRFRFLEVNLSKIIKKNPTNSVNLLGKVNYNIPFNVFINGNFSKSITSLNGNFNFNLIGLVPGKNRIYFQGINGDSFSKIIYYDTQIPKISLLSPKIIANTKKIFLNISDDISIDTTSISLNIGNTIFPNSKISKIGNFYFVDVSNITSGIYNLHVTAKDLVGNTANLNIQNLNINPSNPIIDTVLLSSGQFIANKLFVSTGSNQLTLKPSKVIAFKSIFLDGKRLTDYGIKTNGEVILNVNFINKSGILEFSFIDDSYVISNQNISYFTDNSHPQLNLDYIVNPSSKLDGTVLVSGEILDSNFDWTTLKFNNNDNISFIRFGNFFEAYVSTNSGHQNLLIFGNDISGNNLQNSNYGGILFGDSSKVQISNQINSLNAQSYSGLLNSVDLTNKFVNSYDGFDLKNIYVSDSFELPLQDRQGIRSLNLLGIESSNLKFNSINSFSVDSIKPIAYFTNNSLGQNILVLDGTLSEIDLNSIKLTNLSGAPLTINLNCLNSFSFFSKCLNIGSLTDFNLNFSDIARNKFSKSFSSIDKISLNSLSSFNPNLKPEIFLSGNDKITTNPNYFLQGQIKSESKVNSVKIIQTGTNCIFDDFNFYCPVNLNSGENNFTIEVLDINNRVLTKNQTIILDDSNFNIDLQKISGSSVFKLQNSYTLTTPPKIFVYSNLSKTSLVKLFVNGREILVGNKNKGNFTFNLDLSSDVNNKENTTLNLKLSSVDELGNIANSNSISIFYNRIVKTILQIFVG